MRQVVQPLSGGPIHVVDVPRPTIGPTEVLVETAVSVISAGTEKAVTGLARSGLVGKAKARPDLVRQVVDKAKRDGIAPTLRSVRSRLDEDLPLGYSAAGLVREVGEAVSGVAPGDLVATGGAGWANHAEYQAVPGLLCAKVPESVRPEQAAFATIGSIALHGLRLGDLDTGGRVVVVGLGLVGQLTLRLARASGYAAIGIDVDPWVVERARDAGFHAAVDEGSATTSAIEGWSRGRGADAVIVTAATSSSSVMARVPALCRDRATVVVVGDVGLDLARAPFYEKELTLRFARSYGPGRYDHTYEDLGIDYPPGLVRWTEGRNLEAFLDLLASARIEVDDLITHTFEIADAERAYELVASRAEPYLAIQLTYPHQKGTSGPISVGTRSSSSAPGVGLIGAGSFARSVLVPALGEAGFDRLVGIASASGRSARHLAERAGFEKVMPDAESVISDPDTDVVVIATPHDAHARLTVQALRAGKHVFCEKPLALSEDELSEVVDALGSGGGVLFVGFNRRWSEPVSMARGFMKAAGAPLALDYRISAGKVPTSHWYRDRRQGGRLLGEVCHFIDTCGAIVQAEVTSVHALGSGRNETLLDEDVVVSLRYRDGSLATINYASGGGPGTKKERLEILGGGRSAVIDDFSRVELDGKATAIRPQDKGHVAQMKAFMTAVRSGDPGPLASFLASTRTTLAAAASLTKD